MIASLSAVVALLFALLIPASPFVGVLFPLVFGTISGLLFWFSASATVTVDARHITYRRLWMTSALPSDQVWSVEVRESRSGRDRSIGIVVHGAGAAVVIGMLNQFASPRGRARIQARRQEIVSALGGDDVLLRRRLPTQVREDRPTGETES